MDERSQSILLQTVSDYIVTAEPIGSRTLSKRISEKWSPATIRNVMSDLEDLGYLHQPHPSAGRIPTDHGYRFFVDQFLKLQDLQDESKKIAQSYQYDLRDQSMEDVLESACNLLSKTSHQTGLVMLPTFSSMMLKHIDFIKVGKNEVLAVFLSDMGIMQNKILQVDREYTQEKLASISNYLNDEFSGKSLTSIRSELIHRVQNEKEHYDQLMKRASELWAKVFDDQEDISELFVDGLINFLDQPEFSTDIDKMKALLKTVEEKSKLIKLLDLCMKQDGMTIFIGAENQEEEMQDCSLIAQNYGLDGEKVGTMAIIGPKRMDYKNAISIVNTTAKTVSKLLSERKKRGV